MQIQIHMVVLHYTSKISFVIVFHALVRFRHCSRWFDLWLYMGFWDNCCERQRDKSFYTGSQVFPPGSCRLTANLQKPQSLNHWFSGYYPSQVYASTPRNCVSMSLSKITLLSHLTKRAMDLFREPYSLVLWPIWSIAVKNEVRMDSNGSWVPGHHYRGRNVLYFFMGNKLWHNQAKAKLRYFYRVF